MDDLSMINSPSRWPNRPLLPVIHRTDPERCGLVLDDQSHRIVYELNLFEVQSLADVTKAPQVVYDTTEDLLKEWRVD